MSPSEHLSGSAVQTDAEAQIISSLAEKWGVPLIHKPGKIHLTGEVAIEVDARSPDGDVVVEAYARQGVLKGAQLKKIAQDILKLALFKQEEGRENTRTVIAFASQEAHDSVKGWVRQAAASFGVEMVVIEVSDDLREQIRRAQSRQVMVNLDQVADDVAAPGVSA